MDWFPTLFLLCMILDLNLLVACSCQNLLLYTFLQILPELSLCCHMFHLLLLPWLLKQSHIISTKTLQTPSFLIDISCPAATAFPTILLKHTRGPSGHPGFSPQPWEQTRLHPGGIWNSNQSPSQFYNMLRILRQELSLAFTIFQWCGSEGEKGRMNLASV